MDQTKEILMLWNFTLNFFPGANRNTEIKIWNCASWTCLQTIKFASPATELKAAMDLSAKFILLSDIHRKMVYVLRLDEVSVLLLLYFRLLFAKLIKGLSKSYRRLKTATGEVT